MAPDGTSPVLRTTAAPDLRLEMVLHMQELMRSNDAVLLSFVDALLKEAQIPHFVADVHMSILDGSIGVLPRRVLVEPDRLDQARRLLRDAELGHELS